MGSLLNDIERNTLVGRKPAIPKILARLDEQDRADLIAAIKDVTIPAIAIRTALAKRSIAISLSAIYRYRKGEVDFELE